MRNTIINRITKEAKQNKKVFVITGDAGFGVLDEFRDTYPQRFLNLGIAEQNMISFASGLALTGYKVFVYNIVPFVLYRCYEQVRNDICYQDLPVTLIGIGSGVTYAPQGMTHYSVEDIAIARTMPNLNILSPADPLEALRCAEYAIKSKGPVYIRIAKTGEPNIHHSLPAAINKPIVIKPGEEVAVMFHGSVGIEVINALNSLSRMPKVISVPMVSPIDFNALKDQLRGVRTIITVEEHFIEGGLGSIISDWVVLKNLPYKLIKLGIKNEFIHIIKNNSGMRDEFGISAKKIKEVISAAF